jgi:hypothetical protein
MKEILPEILTIMEEFVSLDKDMMEYYSNAISTAQEEFDTYINIIDSGIEKLEHYRSLLSLIGKDNNYKMVDTVL